jgi:hypothetical protein
MSTRTLSSGVSKASRPVFLPTAFILRLLLDTLWTVVTTITVSVISKPRTLCFESPVNICLHWPIVLFGLLSKTDRITRHDSTNAQRQGLSVLFGPNRAGRSQLEQPYALELLSPPARQVVPPRLIGKGNSPSDDADTLQSAAPARPLCDES